MDNFLLILSYVARWMIFEKMGIEGWKSLIPFYNQYCLYDKVYGDGGRMFYELIPFYGFFVSAELWARIAKGFGKSKDFTWGLVLLGTVFTCILAFDKCEWNNEDETDNEAYLKTSRACAWVELALFAGCGLIMFIYSIPFYLLFAML